MTPAVFYVSSLVFSITGLFALWHFGIKELMLDDFRDSIFLIRDRLYALGKSNRLAYDSEAYRAVELFLNSVIRYAHRFSFSSFVLIRVDEEKAYAESAPSAVVITNKINAVQDETVRRELNGMLEEVAMLLPHYIAKSSMMFILGSLIYYALRSVSTRVANSKREAVETFEREAVREANFSKYATA